MQNAYITHPININENLKINLRTWLLATYLLFAPLDFLPILPGVSISKFLIFLPLLGAVLYLKYIRIRIDRFLSVPLIYLLLLILTMFYSYDINLTQQRIITIGLNITVIFVLSMFRYSKTDLLILKKSMVYSGWFTILLMILYSNNTIIGGGRLTVSVNGAYQDPNYLTGFLIFSVNYYYADIIKNRNKKSIVKIIIFLVFTLLTGSRGGLIAILGSVLFYSLISITAKRSKISFIAKIISAIFLFGLSFNILKSLLPESIADRYNISFTLNDRGADRWNIWDSVFNNYKNSSVFYQFFGRGAGTINYFTYDGNVAHNIWIESLMEIGIIGSLTLFIFYFMYIKKAYNLKENVAAASFIGYMILAMSLSLYSYKPIWNIILLVVLLKNNKKDEDNNNIKKRKLVL